MPSTYLQVLHALYAVMTQVQHFHIWEQILKIMMTNEMWSELLPYVDIRARQ